MAVVAHLNIPKILTVFLKDKQCTVYPVRPAQCRTFPWWKENLSSKEAWRGLQGNVKVFRIAVSFPLNEIEKHLVDS